MEAMTAKNEMEAVLYALYISARRHQLPEPAAASAGGQDAIEIGLTE
jgi:hypothetical protein